MHQHAQILELINLLNDIPIEKKGACVAFTTLEYYGLGLLHIYCQPTRSTEC